MNKWYPVRYMSTLIWIGFLLGISFLEAPLKFQAPSVTLPIGLEIGQLVFGALNKVEWILFLCLMLSLIFANATRKSKTLTVLLGVILLFQTFYLLPTLDERATLIISGYNPPPSNVHFYYVGLEVVKLLLLGYATVWFVYRSANDHLEQ